MPGLVPGLPMRRALCVHDRDCRDEPGDDDGEGARRRRKILHGIAENIFLVSLDQPLNLCLLSHISLIRGASPETVPEAERDAAPAGEARHLAPGRPRGARPLPLRGAAFSGWTRRRRRRAKARRQREGVTPPVAARKNGSGDTNRRGGAPGGASSRSHGKRRRLASVSGGRAGRSGSLASSRVSRRSAPLMFCGSLRKHGEPGAAQKNTGGGALACREFQIPRIARQRESQL